MARMKCAIIGSGNIGTDLMIKLLKGSDTLELAAGVGIDPASEGLAMARERGVATTHGWIEGLCRMPQYADIGIAFDATSAYAHKAHDEILARDGKLMVDLTPAAIGPATIPPVNPAVDATVRNINMVTCGGQATIPIVAAVSQVAKVHYAEIVASVSSRSAGPGTRANIDEFTRTTARAIETVGGAAKGRAVIILNPAEPPMIMRDTIFTLSEMVDADKVRDEEALFHLYNNLFHAKSSLLLTASQRPKQWGVKLKDLQSRLYSLPAVEVKSPDEAVLSAVFLKHFADRQIQIAPDVIHYIIPRIERSFAAVARIVEVLDRHALSQQRAITIPLARQVLASALNPT